MPVVLGLYPWFCASAQADGLQFVEETSTHFPQPNPTEYTNQLTIGDIDGDGDFDLDVKTASTGSNNSRLDRNDGTGVFSLVTDIPSDSTCYSYDFGDIMETAISIYSASMQKLSGRPRWCLHRRRRRPSHSAGKLGVDEAGIKALEHHGIVASGGEEGIRHE